MNPQLTDRIQRAHQRYQALTGTQLPMAPHRERLWYEWFKAGYRPEDLDRVIEYLKQQIRHQRQNVGALKLSNLLQLDRFEEDLAISRIDLRAKRKTRQPVAAEPPLSAALRDAGTQRTIEFLRTIKRAL